MTPLNTTDRSTVAPFGSVPRGALHPPVILAAPSTPPAPWVSSVAPGPERPALSAREVEVLLAWLGTLSKEDAAAQLNISPATVGTHILRIRSKYRHAHRPAPSKAHLLARAIQDGYTTLDEW